MEQSTTYKLSIPELKSCVPITQQVGIGDDFCIFRVKSVEHLSSLEDPCRFEGLMVLYCVKGHVTLSVNLIEYELTSNHLFIVSPEKLIKVSRCESEETDMVIVAMSPKFASELQIDFKRLMNEALTLKNAAGIILTDRQEKALGDYLALMAQIVNADNPFKDNILTSLVSSMISFVAGIWSKKLNESEDMNFQVSTRSRTIFEQFIRLVGEYHTKYRNVGFYADKLCLTPKYLSKLIKTASGRSAPEWIDAFVILEAKNLLRHSDISIKEIVYRLNFPNQSVFYKFFKCRTDMTPSEYRNS